METRKLFDLDSSCRRFCAQVLDCQPDPKAPGSYAVLLDQTVFFPEGGGQPSDQGRLGEAEVLYVWERGGLIYHRCSKALEVGSTVEGELDWPLRFQHMQTHCGEHILSGLILREFGLHNVGFHMGHEATTIDLDGELTPAMVEQVEQLVNKAIGENVPVHVSYPSPEALAALPLRKKPEVEHLRVVEVEGYDACGCCGTHVAHTGEIQLLKILDAQRYKGGTRLTLLFGQAAIDDYSRKHKSLKTLAESFSCKPAEVEDNVAKLRQELVQAQQALSQKNKALFGLLGPKLLAEAPKCVGGCRWVFLYGGFSAEEMKAFAQWFSHQEATLCTFFAPGERGLRYALGKSADVSLSLRELCKALNKAQGGKGGGNEELCCGNLSPVDEESLRTWLSQELC